MKDWYTIGFAGQKTDLPFLLEKWVRKMLIRLVEQLEPNQGVTSLSNGTDLLFAKVLINHNIPYAVVIPVDSNETYFDSHERARLFHQGVHHEIQCSGTEARIQWKINQWIVDHSHTLIVVWDGLPTMHQDQTANTMTYAVQKKCPVVHINTLTKKLNYR